MCTGLEALLFGGMGGAGVGASILPSLALSIAGAAVNNSINNQYVDAVNNEGQKVMAMEAEARRSEEGRQREMEGEQVEQVKTALDTVNPAEARARAEAEANDPDNQYVAAADQYNQPLQGQISDGETGARIGQIVGDALEKTKGMLKAQSVLGAQGSSLSGSNDALTRMGSAISTLGSNRRGSINVARQETAIPNARVTKSNSIIGDALMLTGQMLGGMAGGKAGFGVEQVAAGAPLSVGHKPWWQGGTGMV